MSIPKTRGSPPPNESSFSKGDQEIIGNALGIKGDKLKEVLVQYEGLSSEKKEAYFQEAMKGAGIVERMSSKLPIEKATKICKQILNLSQVEEPGFTTDETSSDIEEVSSQEHPEDTLPSSIAEEKTYEGKFTPPEPISNKKSIPAKVETPDKIYKEDESYLTGLGYSLMAIGTLALAAYVLLKRR